jgi:hypothetical protein
MMATTTAPGRTKAGGFSGPKHALPSAMRTIAMTLCAVLAATTAGAASRAPNTHVRAITCTNPAGGVSWQIRIDYDRATVDSNPAEISDEEIAWKDGRDGWNYTLDRKTGELSVVVASSTGGYFLHDRCVLVR